MLGFGFDWCWYVVVDLDAVLAVHERGVEGEGKVARITLYLKVSMANPFKRNSGKLDCLRCRAGVNVDNDIIHQQTVETSAFVPSPLPFFQLYCPSIRQLLSTVSCLKAQSPPQIRIPQLTNSSLFPLAAITAPFAPS